MKNVLAVVFAVWLSLLMVLSCDAVPALQLQDIPEGRILDQEPKFPDDTADPDAGIRFRRVTCDILNVTIKGTSVGHAACAAHCLAMRRGFTGGYCKDGVCHCRN